MRLHVLLQILRTFECLPTKVTLMRLERDMDSDMRSNMIALDGCRATAPPLTCQVEIIGTLPTDMALADVFL